MPLLERDFALVSAFVPDSVRGAPAPPVDLRELLLALKDVIKRAELLGHHAIQREALSVRNHAGDLLRPSATASSLKTLFKVWPTLHRRDDSTASRAAGRGRNC